MKVIETDIDGVLIIEPAIFEDPRGYFMETYQRHRYAEAGIDMEFVQDNVSFSKKSTLRGLHYQFPNVQAKLVQVIKGEAFDVAVDIRKGSPSFGKWTSVILSDKNNRQLFIPMGFAHGFCVLSDTALLSYKCSNLYAPNEEEGILWSDPDLGIDWPVEKPVLSEKDGQYLHLKDISFDRLPDYRE